MNTTNMGLLESVGQLMQAQTASQDAERVKAAKVYYTILLTPGRDTEKDKAAITQAMRLLGKSVRDAHEEAMQAEEALGLFEDTKNLPDANAALDKAESDEREFMVERHALHLEIERKLRELGDVREAAQERRDALRRSVLRFREIEEENPELSQFLPKIPRGAQ